MATPLINLVGFDYAQAIRKLNQRYTYEEIAKAIGYDNKSSVQRLLDGMMPSHVHGEALWALYSDTFGCKPPLKRTKATSMHLLSSASGP